MVKQAVAASTITGTIIGVLPTAFAIPAALYYCILIYEKISGKKFSDLFKKKINDYLGK